MKGRIINILTMVLSIVTVSISALTAMAADVPKMTKEDLKAQLGKPDVIIIDVRIGKDWKASELKIKGAIREDPQKVDSWAQKYAKDKNLVFYCA
ncbi:MAG: hypothetical protein KAJ00_11805 [Deltaproteobacteria bacterium]|jgi:rhodanese-related sulfurtransferase|nr:hypothetical protein [Deltaproteobacteria bacterium]MCK5515176.1 hypothetical protein [Deltaproteobacteria bacterium]